MIREISFEDLPSLIQKTIFWYIQAPDLLTIALLSRSLYWTAVRRLYKSITITDTLLYKLAQNQVTSWSVNCGTIVPFKRVKMLVATLRSKGSDKSLGGFVHTLTVHHEKNLQEADIFDLLKYTPNLQGFHNFSKLQIPQNISKRLRIVTCMLGGFLNPSANLEQLRVRDYDGECYGTEFELTDIDFSKEDQSTEENAGVKPFEDESPSNFEIDKTPSVYVRSDQQYRELARMMIDLGACSSLRKLHISSGQLIGEQDINGQFCSSKYSDSWFSFFDELSRRKVKLNLDSLALHGVEKGKAQKVARIIRRCVNVKRLKQLVLAHDKATFKEVDASFLQHLTKNAGRLESLAVFFTSVDIDDQLDSLYEVLTTHVPKQLKDLSVTMDHDDSMEDRYEIHDVIMESQRNLVRLKIEDSHPLISHPYRIDKDIDLIFDFMSADWGEELFRQQLFPSVIGQIHSRPSVSTQHASAIMSGLTRMSGFMSSDQIFLSAPDYLQLISEYYLGGVFFDVRNRGVYINERTVGLEMDIYDAHLDEDDYSEEDTSLDHGDLESSFQELIFQLLLRQLK